MTPTRQLCFSGSSNEWHCGCSTPVRRLIVSNRTCAILTMMAGAAFGAWWLATQRVMAASAARRRTRDHGTVIFDNHVPASDVADALV